MSDPARINIESGNTNKQFGIQAELNSANRMSKARSNMKKTVNTLGAFGALSKNNKNGNNKMSTFNKANVKNTNLNNFKLAYLNKEKLKAFINMLNKTNNKKPNSKKVLLKISNNNSVIPLPPPLPPVPPNNNPRLLKALVDIKSLLNNTPNLKQMSMKSKCDQVLINNMKIVIEECQKKNNKNPVSKLKAN